MLQRELAETEERCARFDGRAASARALLRRLRELTARVHALHQPPPPPALLAPLAAAVLPALGDAQQDKNLARLAFLLLALGVDALLRPAAAEKPAGAAGVAEDLELVRELEAALLNRELGLDSPAWRKAAALRVYARVVEAKALLAARARHHDACADPERGPVVEAALEKALAPPRPDAPAQQSSRRLSKFLSRGGSGALGGSTSSGLGTSGGGAVGSGSGDGPGSSRSGFEADFASIGTGDNDEEAGIEESFDLHKRRSFLMKRRRSSTRSTGSSGSDHAGVELANNAQRLPSYPLGRAAFDALRVFKLIPSDLDAAVEALASGDATVGVAACEFLAHAARNAPVQVAARLYAHIPHCKQPSSADLVGLGAAACRVRWAELCGVLASSGQCADEIAHAFYVSLALLVRDRGPWRVRLAAVSALAKCPWRFCNTLVLPAYPATAAEEPVLSCVVRELLDVLSHRPSQAARFCACRALCALARARVEHVSMFGASLLESASLQVLWPHLIALCRTTSSETLQLEATKAMIWLANDRTSQSEAGGSSGRQIKALTSGFKREDLGEVLHALEARVRFDPGLAWLLLDLAYSRYADDPETIGVSSLFVVWRSCLRRADPAVSSAVLRDLLALLDTPAIVGSHLVLIGFLNEHLDVFARLPGGSGGANADKDGNEDGLKYAVEKDAVRPVLGTFSSAPVGAIAHRLLRGALVGASPEARHMSAQTLCRLALLSPAESRGDLRHLLVYLASHRNHFVSSLGVIETTLALLSSPEDGAMDHAAALADALFPVSPLAQ